MKKQKNQKRIIEQKLLLTIYSMPNYLNLIMNAKKRSPIEHKNIIIQILVIILMLKIII